MDRVQKDGGANKKGDIIHSAIMNNDKKTFNSNAGTFPSKDGLSLEGGAGKSFGGKLMTDITKAGTVAFYKHKGDKKSTLSGGVSIPGAYGTIRGVKEYKKSEVSSSFRFYTWDSSPKEGKIEVINTDKTTTTHGL